MNDDDVVHRHAFSLGRAFLSSSADVKRETMIRSYRTVHVVEGQVRREWNA